MNVFELIKEKLEETSFYDIHLAVSEILSKYGFPKDCIVQDEIWDALDEISINKFAISIVDEVAQEYNNGWIPCSEKMPEEHDSMFAEVKGTDKWREGMFEKISDDVNVTVKYKNGKVKSMTTHTIDGKWKLDSIVKGEVTHWQPLPAPYKVGGV